MIPVLRLHRFLPQQLFGCGKRIVQLVIQIVTVCDDDDCRIVHFGSGYELGRIKYHAQAFSRPLRMPDNASPFISACTRRLYGGLNRFVHCIILMIRRYFFLCYNLSDTGFCIGLFVFFKYRKVADKVKQCRGIQHPFE